MATGGRPGDSCCPTCLECCVVGTLDTIRTWDYSIMLFVNTHYGSEDYGGNSCAAGAIVVSFLYFVMLILNEYQCYQII